MLLDLWPSILEVHCPEDEETSTGDTFPVIRTPRRAQPLHRPRRVSDNGRDRFDLVDTGVGSLAWADRDEWTLTESEWPPVSLAASDSFSLTHTGVGTPIATDLDSFALTDHVVDPAQRNSDVLLLAARLLMEDT